MNDLSNQQPTTRYVAPAECSSCTGAPHLDSNGVALFCEDCSKRAHAAPRRYDIGRGGEPDRASPDGIKGAKL